MANQKRETNQTRASVKRINHVLDESMVELKRNFCDKKNEPSFIWYLFFYRRDDRLTKSAKLASLLIDEINVVNKNVFTLNALTNLNKRIDNKLNALPYFKNKEEKDFRNFLLQMKQDISCASLNQTPEGVKELKGNEDPSLPKDDEALKKSQQEELDKLNGQVTRLNKFNNDLLNILETSSVALEGRNQAYVELFNTKNLLNKATENEKLLTAKLQSEENEKNQSRTLLDLKVQENSELKRKLTVLQESSDEMKGVLDTKVEENAELKTKLSTLNKQSTELQSELKNQESRAKFYFEKNVEISKEFVEKKIVPLSTYNKLETELNKKQNELANRDKDLTAKCNKNACLVMEINDLKETNRMLSSNLNKMKETNRILNLENKKLKAEKIKTDNLNTELKKENGQLKSAVLFLTAVLRFLLTTIPLEYLREKFDQHGVTSKLNEQKKEALFYERLAKVKNSGDDEILIKQKNEENDCLTGILQKAVIKVNSLTADESPRVEDSLPKPEKKVKKRIILLGADEPETPVKSNDILLNKKQGEKNILPSTANINKSKSPKMTKQQLKPGSIVLPVPNVPASAGSSTQTSSERGSKYSSRRFGNLFGGFPGRNKTKTMRKGVSNHIVVEMERIPI